MDYRKWVAPAVRYGCEVAGVSLAWFLQMTISAFHSSARGAQLFARGTLAYAVRHGYLQPNAAGYRSTTHAPRDNKQPHRTRLFRAPYWRIF